MKTRNLIHHIILMTVCLVGTLSAYAQGIVVTMNDGTEQLFSEETIQEMFLSGYDGIDLSKGFIIKVNGKEIFFSAEELAKVSVYGYEPVNIKETPAEAVDLGLPSGRKWASYNVGATEPEGYGSYFAWGELFDKETYDWSNYKYCNGNRYSLTKYVDRSSYGRMDGQRVLLPEDDVAQQRWGGGWRTPTHEDQLELVSNCEKTAVEVNGVKGIRFTGPNGNSIFLPGSGYASLNQWTFHRDGYYWSSTITYRTPAQTLVDDYSAWIVQMYGSNTSTAYSSMERCYGLPVRPVRDDLSIAQKDTNMVVGSVLVFPVVTGSKHYAASSSDPAIATAVVEGSNVTVTAISSGEVIITVNDTEYNQSVTLKIIVNEANQGFQIYDAYIIPSYGQSLAICTSGGETTFKDVEPYAYSENMGHRPEDFTMGSYKLDLCQGIAEGFRLVKEANNIVLPEKTKIITFAVGSGGLTITNLSKGHTNPQGYDGYNSLLDKIRTAKRNCDVNGLTCCVPCIGWTQGESDMFAIGGAYGEGDFIPTEYHTKLIALIENLNSDIKEITGQKEDVVFVTYQTATHTAYFRYPRIALEQGLADELSDKIYLVKPNYNVVYVSDQVHCPNATYREMGNHYGIAAAEIALLNKEPSRLYPKTFSLNGNKMVIKFNVPNYPICFGVDDGTTDTPLSERTNNVRNLDDGNYGFCVYNVDEANGTISIAGTAITDVKITDIDEITITFSRTPVAGERLTYGINGGGWEHINGIKSNNYKSGKKDGSRGCIRDSSTLVNNTNNIVYDTLPKDDFAGKLFFSNMYNWCRIFEYKF